MTTAHAEKVRDHWYWRPGWSVGRRFYTWHLTFADQPEVVAMAERYRAAIESVDCLDPIPPRWLHLTMQGLGFIDEVDKADVDRIVDDARARCAALPALHLVLGAPQVDPESIQIAVAPSEPVRRLRSAIRTAIGQVWGSGNIPEPETPFAPHLSLAYTNAPAPGQPLAQVLGQVEHVDVHARITECQLIVLHRDNRMYEWETYAHVNLGS